MDPHRAAAFQRDQLDSGKNLRYRVYRFATEGVDRLTRRPAKGEESRPSSQWSEVDQHFEPYPHWAGSDLVVSEPTALFYFLSAANLQRTGDRVQVPTFSKNNLLLVELTVQGKEKVKVDYVEQSAAGKRRVKKTIEALRILVDARHLDPDSNESQMEFMGLRGDIVMLFDPTTRVPLELSGKVKIAGTVKVKLQQAVLK